MPADDRRIGKLAHAARVADAVSPPAFVARQISGADARRDPEVSGTLNEIQGMADMVALLDPSGLVSAGNALVYAMRAMEEPGQRADLLTQAAVSAVGAIPMVGKLAAGAKAWRAARVAGKGAKLAGAAGRAGRSTSAAADATQLLQLNKSAKVATDAAKKAVEWAGQNRMLAMTITEALLMLSRPAFMPHEGEQPSQRLEEGFDIVRQQANAAEYRDTQQATESLIRTMANVAMVAAATGKFRGTIKPSMATKRRLVKGRRFLRTHRKQIMVGAGVAATAAGARTYMRMADDARRQVDRELAGDVEPDLDVGLEDAAQEAPAPEFVIRAAGRQHRPQRRPRPVAPRTETPSERPPTPSTRPQFSMRPDTGTWWETPPTYVYAPPSAPPAPAPRREREGGRGLLGLGWRLPNPLAPITAILGGLVTAGVKLVDLAQAADRASDSLLLSQEQYVAFSGTMAVARARFERGRIERQMEFAHGVGGSYAMLSNLRNWNAEMNNKYAIFFQNVQNDLTSVFLGVTGAAKHVIETATLIDEAVEWYNRLRSGTGEPPMYRAFMEDLLGELGRDATRPTARPPRGRT